MTINVPWIGPPTNKMYAGQHWSRRKITADTGHMATFVEVREFVGNRFKKPVTLTFTPHHNGRLYDLDGYLYTCKIIIDGLVKAGLLKDDSQKYVRGITILPTVKSEDRFMQVDIEEAPHE